MRRMAPHLPSLGSLGTPAEACAISRYCKGFGWSWCTALCCRTDDGKQLNSERSHHKRHLVGGVGGGPAHVVGDDPASSASSHLCPFAGVIGHRRFMGSPAGPSIISIIVPQGSLDTGRFSCMFLKLRRTLSRGRCLCCFKLCAVLWGLQQLTGNTTTGSILVPPHPLTGWCLCVFLKLPPTLCWNLQSSAVIYLPAEPLLHCQSNYAASII